MQPSSANYRSVFYWANAALVALPNKFSQTHRVACAHCVLYELHHRNILRKEKRFSFMEMEVCTERKKCCTEIRKGNAIVELDVVWVCLCLNHRTYLDLESAYRVCSLPNETAITVETLNFYHASTFTADNIVSLLYELSKAIHYNSLTVEVSTQLYYAVLNVKHWIFFKEWKYIIYLYIYIYI